MFLILIALFLILGLLLILGIRALMSARLAELSAQVKMLEIDQKEAFSKQELVEKEIASLYAVLTKTVKMYEAARDICTSLDEEKLLARFKEDLKKLIDLKDCILLPEGNFDPGDHPDSAVFPLVVKEMYFGHLVIRGVAQQEHPYLGILVGHFALGLKRARLYKMIQELAITDGLTGLYTRRYASERLKEEFARSLAHNLELSLLMIDADDFKECNDKLGHLVGDIVLCEIGNRIRENIREVDMLSRFGGEEFMVFAPNTSKESASLIAERIRKGVEDVLIRAYDEKVKMTVSIGLASFPEDAKSPEDLIGKSDWALYQAKKLGKNRLYCFGVFRE
ncbi:MAG: GGDEF domain-containing protein [Candidatus Omnitrophota bacterium]